MAELVTVPIFESSHMGFGDAQKVENFRYHRIHGSVDARWPGQVRMGLQIRELSQQNHSRVPVFATFWPDATAQLDFGGTTTLGTPRIYYLAGLKYMRVQNGAVTEVGSDLLVQIATGAAFDDDGSGTPYIYVGFDTVQTMRRITSAEGISAAGDTTISANLLMSLAGRLYRTYQATSGQPPNAVSLCPFGANRMTAANWSALQVVGWAGTPINALVGIRQAPVAVKPEGVFAYSDTHNRWINYMPAWEKQPHEDNGKGTFSLGDVLVIPIGGGGAVMFDGFNVQPFDPSNGMPNTHTTSGELSALGALRQWIVGASTPGGQKFISAGSSLEVRTEISSVFADLSANVRDGSLATTGAIPLVLTTDYLWIGWTRPFAGFRTINSFPNTSVRTTTVSVGQADGTYVAVTHRDFTLSASGAPLARTGAVIFTEDPVGVRNWARTSVNGVTAYWARYSVSGSLHASTAVREIQILPWYPSLDDTNYPLDGLDRSGCFPHVLLGRIEGSRPIWHDVATLPEPDEIGAILYAWVGGSSANRYHNLVLCGRFSVWVLDLPPEDKPGTMGAPFLNNRSLYEAPALVPIQGSLSTLRAVRIIGIEGDSAVPLRLYYTWDYGKPWSRIPTLGHRFPLEAKVVSNQRGYLFRMAFGWAQSAAAATLSQPTILRLEADFEPVAGDIDSAPQRELATQPRF